MPTLARCICRTLFGPIPYVIFGISVNFLSIELLSCSTGCCLPMLTWAETSIFLGDYTIKGDSLKSSSSQKRREDSGSRAFLYFPHRQKAKDFWKVRHRAFLPSGRNRCTPYLPPVTFVSSLIPAVYASFLSVPSCPVLFLGHIRSCDNKM